MTTPTKADILNAAAIERMICDAPCPSTHDQEAWAIVSDQAYLRMKVLNLHAKDMDDE
jgi:hypothetical protein